MLHWKPEVLEEIAMNAWPALKQVLYDGWVLRFAEGFTGRANSVNLLYQAKINPEEKIDYCRELFDAWGIPLKFRLTPYFNSSSLEEILIRKGYIRSESIHVMVKKFEGGVSWGFRDDVSGQVLSIQKWIEAYYSLNKDNRKFASVHQRMLGRIGNRTLPLVLLERGSLVACGFGVYERGYFGIFNLFTDEKYRSRGFATEILKRMFSWAIDHGAKIAYLQVDESNLIARRLYKKIGFFLAYPYWYRSLES